MDERRRYQRVPLATRVILVSSGAVETYSSRDISAGGVFLYAQDAPAIGSRVQVELATAEDRHDSLPGIIVRQETAGSRSGFAVEFQLADEQRAELEQALLGR